LHDGPGLRTSVFLKGCPLTCLWCHNPESQSFEPELYYFDEKCTRCGLCGAVCAVHSVTKTEHAINRKDCGACGKCAAACPQSALEIKGSVMPAQDVMDAALKDARYYKRSGGGLTLSGGEPLAQFGFALELLRLAKENGIHTCLETSGYAAAEQLLAVMPYVDLFLYDFKESGEDEHIKSVGAPRGLIMDNLSAIDKAGARIVLRCPIIPACNERDGHFKAIAAAANSLRNIAEVNIMPYHPLGASKAARIGRDYMISDMRFPTEAQIDGWIEKVRRGTDVLVKRG